jgi:hypothetical protein
MDRVRTYGVAASGGVAVVASIVLVVASRSHGDFGPPEAVPRGLVLGLLFSVPAVIGLVGVRRRDRALLVSAALASLVPSTLSVATLPLVIPALLYIVAAADRTAATRRPTWLIGAAIVALGVGSLVGLFTNTENRCWVAFAAPNGLVYRDAAEAEVEGEMGGPGQPTAAGCDGGALTVRGAGLAFVLAIGGLALALGAPRPRPVVGS